MKAGCTRQWIALRPTSGAFRSTCSPRGRETSSSSSARHHDARKERDCGVSKRVGLCSCSSVSSAAFRSAAGAMGRLTPFLPRVEKRLTASRVLAKFCDRGLSRFKFQMKLRLRHLFPESLLFAREENGRRRSEQPRIARRFAFLLVGAIRSDECQECLSVETTKSVYVSMRQTASRSLYELPKIVCSLRHGMPPRRSLSRSKTVLISDD